MNYTPAQLFALEKETLLTIALATSAGTVLCAAVAVAVGLMCWVRVNAGCCDVVVVSPLLFTAY
jgi:hypothetical protein